MKTLRNPLSRVSSLLAVAAVTCLSLASSAQAGTVRGTVKNVGSSYGPLVNKIERDAEGKVNEVTYGDVAHTKTHSSYDTRRRLSKLADIDARPQR